MGDNINNRHLGEVYTPEHIALKMKEMAKENLGDDFEEKFVIWDNCCGTFNLEKVLDGTGELFCSTLRKQDIRRNQKEQGEKFVYNFLTEDIEQLKSLQAMWGAEHENLPERLVEVLENEDEKPLLFYINPPYAGTGNFGNYAEIQNKEVDKDTELRKMMRNDRMGYASDNTYTQWLYKITKMKKAYANKKMYIVLISPLLYLTANSYTNFREMFFSEFSLKDGIIFRATEFGNLCGRYGISITVWEPGVQENKQEFKFKLYRTEKSGFNQFGFKTIYNSMGQRGDEIVVEDNMNLDRVISDVTLSSGCRVSNKKKIYWEENGIAYIFSKGNNVYHNCTEAGIMSRPFSDGGGLTVTEDNIKDAMAYLVARLSVGIYDRSWIWDKDEYLRPDVNSEAYKVLQENGIIYSIFNDNSHLVGINTVIDGEDIEIKNDFHFMSVDMTSKMFTENGLEVPDDLEERLIVKYIKEAINSGYMLKSGIEVLKYAQRLFIDTYKLRLEFDKKEENKIYQCTRWDAGYYQLKWALKEFDKDKYKEFRSIYRKFSDELIEYVYACGFLKHRPIDLNGNITLER